MCESESDSNANESPHNPKSKRTGCGCESCIVEGQAGPAAQSAAVSMAVGACLGIFYESLCHTLAWPVELAD